MPQAAVPISVPEIAYEILAGDTLPPTHPDADRDEKYVAINAINLRMRIASPNGSTDIARAAAQVQNSKRRIHGKGQHNGHQLEIATLLGALLRLPQLQQLVEK